MLNISTESKNLYKQNRLPNVASIAEVHLFIKVLSTGTIITDNQIESENFRLDESICSEKELYFGGCEASSCSFAVYNVSEKLIGQKIQVWQTIGDNAEVVKLGFFKVSAETKRDGNTGLWKDIVAYDYLADTLETDVLDWWKGLWNDSISVTVGEIWKGLLTHLGIPYTNQTLANDDKVVTNNINPSGLTARNVLVACGELSGVFGRMGRDGNFQWVSVYDARHANRLYPAETLYPASTLFPVQASGGTYGTPETMDGINPIYFADQSHYEDYTVQPIDSVIIQDYDGALAVKVGDAEANPYIVFGNLLTWGMSSDVQTEVANTLYSIIFSLSYVPNVTAMIGLPYLECGDVVSIVLAKDKIITTPVFQRSLAGIMALTDQVTASGPEYRVNRADSTKMTFALDASDAITRVTLEKTATEIRAEVSAQIADSEIQMTSAINQKADQIELSVSSTYQTKSAMSSYSTTSQMNSAIKVAIDGITLAGKTINLTANDIKIASTNFNVDKDGNVTCKSMTATNATVTGTINATGGSITGATITLTDASSSGVAKIRVTNSSNANSYATMWSNTVQVRTASTTYANLNTNGVQATVTSNGVQDYGQYYAVGISLRHGTDAYLTANFSSFTYNPISGGTGKARFTIDGNNGVIRIQNTENALYGCTFHEGYGADALTINHNIFLNGSSGNCYGVVVNQYNTLGTILQYTTKIQGSGVITPSVTQTSDRRLKEDILPIREDYAKTIYRRLAPKSFRFRNDEQKKTRFGLIAQEVQEVFDDWENCNIVTEVDGYYYISYSELHALHISMIQQQERKIDELTSENARLWAEIQMIKEHINL